MYDIYIIKQGDTLEGISKKFNITPSNLYKLNGFNPDYILKTGNQIIVPKNSNPYFYYYTIKQGDNLYGISKKYHINEELLAQINGLDKDDYIYPNQVIAIPKEGVNIYITKEGDTLMGIANGIKANMSVLLYENPNIYLLPDQIIIYKEKQ